MGVRDRTHNVSASLMLGDGDDRASAAAIPARVRVRMAGGPGADHLTGGAGADSLNGDAGADVLRGGPGDDQLSGDAGGGLDPDALADDVLDGGPGIDVVDYSGRDTPVFVDLADPGPDGGAGEADRLISIEDVRGGAGDDVLRGDDGPNRLDGGMGRVEGRGVVPDYDIVDGRGGDDVLHGDQVDGGDGDDRITTGERGRLVCGRGRDRLLVAGYDDGLRAPRDCELLTLSDDSLAVERTATLRRRRLTVTLWAYPASYETRSRGTVAYDISLDIGRVESRPRRVRVRFAAGGLRQSLSFAMSAAGARQLRRTNRLRVRAGGDQPAKIRVKHPRRRPIAR